LLGCVSGDATKQIVGLLRERHHLNPGEEDDFNIRSPEDVIQLQLSMQKTMRLLLASIASLSLIVGGIGIMNIMLVSVTQRTREIGIRLAVGATEWDVQSQFLAEAVTIAILGGLLGMMLGSFSSGAVQSLFGFPTLLTRSVLAGGAGFAAAVGILFGFYPARKASQLDPIQGLRYE
jgi:putative ABC transport system permease protein